MCVNLYRMFNEQQILTYIGMAVVVVFAFYYIYKVTQVQRNVIEGLTNKQKDTSIADLMAKSDISELKKSNEKMADTLLIDKYRNDYEDMLIDFETAIDNSILYYVTIAAGLVGKDGAITVGEKPAPNTISIQLLNSINGLYDLKKNLNTTMEFLDNTSSSSSGTKASTKKGGLW